MRWLVGWSVRAHVGAIALAVGLIVLGAFQVSRSAVDTLPEFQPVEVEVQTEALGLSAEEVEQLVTVPLEQDLLNGVAFLDDIESASLPGLSSVVMTFEPGTDLLDARQVVQERLTQAHALPQVADAPRMLQPRASTSRVAMVRLTSDDLIEASVLARWVIVPRLLGVDGVANVSMWGFRDRQLQVLVDPQQLADSEVTLNEVIRTSGNALEVSPLSYLEASQPGTGGWIDTVNQRLHIFHEQAITSADELAAVPLEDGDGEALVDAAGQTIALGDVTEVREDHQPLIGDANCGDGPCLVLVLEKFPAATTPEVAAGIDDALDALRPGLGDLQVDTSVYRPAEYVRAGLSNLALLLGVGGVLLALAVGGLFLDWRRVVMVLVASASSLALAWLVLWALDTTLNWVVLAGLVAGVAVIADEAVVDAADLGELRPGHADAAPFSLAVLSSAVRLRGAALFAAFVAVAALAPVFVSDGMAGAFLPPLVLSWFLAVAASLLVAAAVTPALAKVLFRGVTSPVRETWFTGGVRRGWDRVGPGVVGRTGLPVTAAAVGVVVLAAAIPALSTAFAPRLQERDLLVHLQAEAGTSLPMMDEVVAGLVDDVDALEGVASVGAHVGRAVTSDQIVDVNEAELWIHVAPDADPTAVAEEVDAAVAAAADTTTGADLAHEVTTYSDQRVSAVLGGRDDTVVVRVYGEDDVVLEEQAELVRSAALGVDGVATAEVQGPPTREAITVTVDLERARAHGVKPGDVRRAAAVLVSGITVGNLFDDQKVFDVVVWGSPDIRGTAEDVSGLLVDAPSGEVVAIDEIADVQVRRLPAVIRHHSVMSYRDVVVEPAGAEVAAVADRLDTMVAGTTFPLAYHAEVLRGDLAAGSTLTWVLAGAAVVAILLLLQAAFGSWRLAILALATLPAALAGALLVVLATGAELDLAAVIGLGVVLLVTTRTLVLQVRHYRHLQDRGGMAFGDDLVLVGTRDRVATTLAAAVGVTAILAPLAVAGARPGLELAHPLALVVLGGLVTSVIATVVVLPGLHRRFGDVASPDRTAEDLADDRHVDAAVVGGR